MLRKEANWISENSSFQKELYMMYMYICFFLTFYFLLFYVPCVRFHDDDDDDDDDDNNNNNKKYVLWNAGICPIASKVGHVTLVSSLKKSDF